MVQKFEVGKSYKSNRFPGGALFKIMYLGTYQAFYRLSSGQEGTIRCTDAPLYEEYHEPKVEKFVRYCKSYPNQEPFVSMDPNNTPSAAPLGKIEITLTDGKLSSVNIVEGE